MKDEHSLTVYFVGICTHFMPWLAGDRHRVVVVNARTEHEGIEPHIPCLRTPNGDIDLYGVTIRVANIDSSASPELVYQQSFMRCVPRMICHTHQRIDPDLDVTEGKCPAKAAAYFDLTAGELHAGVASEGAVVAWARIHTTGAPILELTTFETGTVLPPLELPNHSSICLENVADPGHDSPKDYELHFRTVTSEQTIRVQPPTREEIASHCGTGTISVPCLKNTIGPGCSNSMYP